MKEQVTEEILRRQQELTRELDAAARAYYQEDRELMSNRAYDEKYDELLRLEQLTGTVLSGSPTQRVGYTVLSELPKERHEQPMLSLDKTKDRQALADWLGDKTGILSWKMDGLTIVLTYRGGQLVKAVTRGNGEIGEVITENAKVFANVPLRVPFTGELILRGEAVISYEDFEKINARIGDADAKYKNPRNLCSGSVRQLNTKITAERGVHFIAFSLVRAEDMEFARHSDAFDWLASLGFTVVERETVTRDTLIGAVERFEQRIPENRFPSDGLVLLYDDIAYGRSLGRTAKFPRDSIAFKWADETAETHLKEIEWSPSRTGLINPVAVFDPVELEGTTVSRASVHNVSILRALSLGVGDRITVYKANMIIPQIAENLTRSGTCEPPSACPVCGGKTEIAGQNDALSLYCTNPDCDAKRIGSYAHAAGRDALNIEGLSEATLERLVDAGLIHSYADLFRLSEHRDAITRMEGFGDRSFEKLTAAADAARRTTPARLLYALGIPGIGLSNAKALCQAFDDDLDRLLSAGEEELAQVAGIGAVLAGNVTAFFAKERNRQELAELLSVTEPVREERRSIEGLAGKTFVVTGSLNTFENRGALKAAIEAAGGKVAGSVSAKTDYLINNDPASGSSKNRAARELGIPILTEEEIRAMLGL